MDLILLRGPMFFIGVGCGGEDFRAPRRPALWRHVDFKLWRWSRSGNGQSCDLTLPYRFESDIPGSARYIGGTREAGGEFDRAS